MQKPARNKGLVRHLFNMTAFAKGTLISLRITKLGVALSSCGLLQRCALVFSIVLIGVMSAGAQSTGGVKGKVRNINGDGIGGATITARKDGNDVGSTTADRKGSFRLEGIPEGTYNIVIEAQGYSSGVKYGVEIERGKVRDLGERLILMVDRGTLVLVQGSVFFKDGTSVAGARVQIDEVRSDGSKRSLGSATTSLSGEFTYRRKEGPARLRITASHKGASASKEIEVDSAAIYRVALTLDAFREN